MKSEKKAAPLAGQAAETRQKHHTSKTQSCQWFTLLLSEAIMNSIIKGRFNKAQFFKQLIGYGNVQR